MNQEQSKKKVIIFTVIGVLIAFIIGGLSYSMMNGDKKKDTSTQSESSSQASSNDVKSSSKKEKKTEPNLVGSYVADTGTDATVKSIGKNEWQINYQTGPEAVFGNFKTDWKEDAEGFKAKGTMYKGQEKYEFDFMVKVVSEKDGNDAVLIEFSDGDPNHLMTFKNKVARDTNLTGSNTGSSNKSATSKSGGLTGITSYNDLLKDGAWRYRAALLLRASFNPNVDMNDVVAIYYEGAHSGTGWQMISLSGKQNYGFNLRFQKKTQDLYITNISTTTMGGSVTNGQTSLRDAYAKYNDSTTEAMAEMIK